MSSPRKRSALSPTGFYGWHVVAYSAVALAATGPGQTVGVSLFIDPLIDDLGLTRSSVSTAYLIGTLAGAFALPWIGRALDRFGIRRTVAVIGAVFGAVLIALSFVSSLVGLTVGFVGLRMAGQGALGLTATTAVALWFSRRRGTAIGIVSAVGSGGISSTPLILEVFLFDYGWRTAWLIEGVAIWLLVIPLGLFAMRDRPSDLGQQPDGPAAAGDQPHPSLAAASLTRAQAMRHPYFWLICAAVAMSGLLTTAVSFHQISLLTARGLTAAQAAGNFVPQTIAGLIATLGTGYLLDRFAGRWMIIASMVLLSGALWSAIHVTPGLSAYAFGAMLGAAGSMIRAVEGTALPRYFGVRHIGAIRGLVAAISVGGTACGPLLFAVVFDHTASYDTVLLAGALPPLTVAVWAFVAHEPDTAVPLLAPTDQSPQSPVEPRPISSAPSR